MRPPTEPTAFADLAGSWRANPTAEGRSPGSFDLYLRRVRSFADWLVADGRTLDPRYAGAGGPA